MISHLATSPWHPLLTSLVAGGRTTEKLLLLGHRNGKKCGALDAHVTFILSAMQKISKEKLKDSKNIAVCFCLQGGFCDFDRFFMDLESTVVTISKRLPMTF